MGRKFGLAKFYFGLIRSVCDLLLINAKLNNNNTEFLWVGGLHTHNLVKPTLLVMVELGFDKKSECNHSLIIDLEIFLYIIGYKGLVYTLLDGCEA